MASFALVTGDLPLLLVGYNRGYYLHDPLKMVGHYPKERGHGLIFISGQKETPGSHLAIRPRPSKWGGACLELAPGSASF